MDIRNAVTHQTGHIDPPIPQGAETLKILILTPNLAHYQSAFY